jgi:hypothetical protein
VGARTPGWLARRLGRPVRGDAGDQPGPAVSADLQVMLVDYQALRDDERATANSQAALASVFVALLAGLFAIVVGDCRFRSPLAPREGSACYELDDAVYVVVPALPFAVLTYIVMLGVQVTIKSFYMRAVENEIRKRAAPALSALPGVFTASSTEFLLTLTSPRRGRKPYIAMLVFLTGSFILAMGGWIFFVAIHLPGIALWISLIYGPVLVLLVHEGIAANHGGRTLARRAAARLARDGQYPALRPFAARGRAPGRSLAGYLLFPRPADVVKWLFVPIAMTVGFLHAASNPHWRASVLWCGVAWLVFEFLVYQARYQWNDIRGAADDAEHPASAERMRLPVRRNGLRGAVLVSAGVIVLRMGGALALAVFLAPPWVRSVLLVSTAAVWALALAYEGARSRSGGGLPAAVVIWVLVGGGYAIRAAVGLALAGVLPWGASASAFWGFSIAAWAIGIVFVTMTWVIEATGHCSGVLPGVLRYPSEVLTRKPHLLHLPTFAGIEVRPGPAGPSAAGQAPLARPLPLISPWNLGLVLAMGFGLVASIPAAPAWVHAASFAVMACVTAVLARTSRPLVLWSVAVVVLAGVGCAAQVATPGAWVVPVIATAVFQGVYIVFRGMSYSDLLAFGAQVDRVSGFLRRVPARVFIGVLRRLIGRKTWQVLNGR